MTNQEHLAILNQGVDTWNKWRKEYPRITPELREVDLSNVDLSGAYLYRTYLSGANLAGANLNNAHLDGSNLVEANLSGAYLANASLTQAYLDGANLSSSNFHKAELYRANLVEANLSRANLLAASFVRADLRKADLSGASLFAVNLSETDLSGADLSGADLRSARLVQTNLSRTVLTGCQVYGIAVWNVKLEGARQNNLIITNSGVVPLGVSREPIISVDNLKVAQFIHLLLNNAEIRDIIDTITSKVVLILGRFTPERKAILDVLRDELRKRNYLPVLFDFEKPASRDLTGTISTLAYLARFIIVDLTDPSSAPHEVATVIPQTVIPVQPLLSQEPLLIDGKEVERHAYSMFKDLQRRYHWVLPTYTYTDQAHLLATLPEHVIVPAEQKAQELAKR